MRVRQILSRKSMNVETYKCVDNTSMAYKWYVLFSSLLDSCTILAWMQI